MTRVTTRGRAVALALCVGLSLVSMPRVAIAAPTDQEMARARQLYENGRRLYEEGSYDGAILAFKKAYELSEDTNLLYNISLSYDRLGEFEQSIEYLDRYRALAPEDEQDELKRKRQSLQRRLDKQRAFEAEAAAAEAERKAREAAQSSEPVTPPPPPPEDDKPRGPRVYGPAAWGLTAATGVSAAFGIGFGASSLSATRRAEDQCQDDVCRDDVEGDIQRSRNHAIVADVAFGVAAASAVALIVVVSVNAARAKKARRFGTQRAKLDLDGFVVRF